MGIFDFGLNKKNSEDLKFQGWRSGILNPHKSPVKNPQKNRSRGWGFGIFEAKKSPKNPQGLRFFFKSGEFHPEDWEFLSLGLGIF